MAQRARATVNVRLVVTCGDDETDEAAQNLRNNGALLDRVVEIQLRRELEDSLLAYFETDSPDVFEVNVQHAIVNVDEVAA